MIFWHVRSRTELNESKTRLGVSKKWNYRCSYYLKWELICQEGADQIARVTCQPQQQEPNWKGMVHIPRFTWAVALSGNKLRVTHIWRDKGGGRDSDTHLRDGGNHEAEDGEEAQVDAGHVPGILGTFPQPFPNPLGSIRAEGSKVGVSSCS